MISQTLNVTVPFNAGNGYVFDMSGWDTIVVQFVSPTGTVNITATNDGGASASSEGSSTTATNFATVQGTKLSDGTAVTAVAATGLFSVGIVGRYVKFGGASAAATSVIAMYSKRM